MKTAINSMCKRYSFFRVVMDLVRPWFRIVLKKDTVTNDHVVGTRSIGKLDVEYDESLYRNYKQLIDTYTSPENRRVIMDLGSGDGVVHAIQFIEKDDVEHFYLVDMYMYPEVVEARIDSYTGSEQRSEQLKKKISILQSDVSKIDQISDSSVHVIISTSLLEHVDKEDVQKVAEEIYAKLTPQGVAMISVDVRDHHNFESPFDYYRHPE